MDFKEYLSEGKKLESIINRKKLESILSKFDKQAGKYGVTGSLNIDSIHRLLKNGELIRATDEVFSRYSDANGDEVDMGNMFQELHASFVKLER